jgi:hypothetical protein
MSSALRRAAPGRRRRIEYFLHTEQVHRSVGRAAGGDCELALFLGPKAAGRCQCASYVNLRRCVLGWKAATGAADGEGRHHLEQSTCRSSFLLLLDVFLIAVQDGGVGD